jgi:hypothetical protein
MVYLLINSLRISQSIVIAASETNAVKVRDEEPSVSSDALVCGDIWGIPFGEPFFPAVISGGLKSAVASNSGGTDFPAL